MKQIKILLVDDEEEFVKTLSERMQIKNLDSDFVLSGEQALESLGNLTPDVMILDLKMPGINGMDVLRHVNKDYPQVQVIILTGHGSEQDKKNVLDLGAFDYFAKPVDLDELIQSISNAYELKIETHGKDSPAESAKFMTVSMKNSRSSAAETSVKANLDGETEAPVKETLGKLVVVGSESEFSEEIIDYGLEMARRMDFEIVALNTAPLICKNFKEFTPPWKKVCEEFQTESEENVRPFQQKADENRIGFTHAVEFVEVDDALEKLKTRLKNISLVVSRPEQLDGQTPEEPGTKSNRRKGFLVYALS